MKIVIDIDNDLYTRLFDNGEIDVADMLKACTVIRDGDVLSKGRWINKKCRDGSYLPCCSVCGESSGTYYEYNYCPNCGARMETERKEND